MEIVLEILGKLLFELVKDFLLILIAGSLAKYFHGLFVKN
jgi:hypothetical protein